MCFILGPCLSKELNLKLESCVEWESLQEDILALIGIEFNSMNIRDSLNSMMMKNNNDAGNDDDKDGAS